MKFFMVLPRPVIPAFPPKPTTRAVITALFPPGKKSKLKYTTSSHEQVMTLKETNYVFLKAYNCLNLHKKAIKTWQI